MDENVIKQFGMSERQFRNIFNGICTGRLNISNDGVKKLLDAIAKKGQLLEFIKLLNEACKVTYIVKEGIDSFDARADRYTYSKNVMYGYGLTEVSRSRDAIVQYFISDIEREYSYEISKEREKVQEGVERLAEKIYAAENLRLEKYNKYLSAYNLWCSKDAYWHLAHTKDIPYPEKFGLTDDELEKLGYYSQDEKNKRLSDYQKACFEYEQTNKFIKGLFTGGKRIPIPSDYGLGDDEVYNLEEGMLLNGGKRR